MNTCDPLLELAKEFINNDPLISLEDLEKDPLLKIEQGKVGNQNLTPRRNDVIMNIRSSPISRPIANKKFTEYLKKLKRNSFFMEIYNSHSVSRKLIMETVIDVYKEKTHNRFLWKTDAGEYKITSEDLVCHRAIDNFRRLKI